MTSPTSDDAPSLLRRFKVKLWSGSKIVLSQDGGAFAVHTGPRRHDAENRYKDMTITVIDAASGKRLRQAPLPYRLKDLMLLPQDGLVAIGNQASLFNGSVAIVNLETQQILHEWPMQGEVSSLSHAPGGKMLATSNEGWIMLVDLQTFEVDAMLQVGQHLRHAAMSPDGERVVTGHDRSAQLWRVATVERLMTFEPQSRMIIDSVRFSPDGAMFFIQGRDLHVLESETGAEIQTIDDNRFITFAEFSPCGRYIMVLYREGVLQWLNPSTGEVVHEVDNIRDFPTVNLDSVSLVADDQWLLAREKNLWRLPLPQNEDIGD
ncbi:MAG: hypothetical protein AAFV19_24090 [Pseudomonadota bacterium]